MNREHKLALIVGFSLVLVVGILISDHFSRARSAKLGGAELSAGDPGTFGAGEPATHETTRGTETAPLVTLVKQLQPAEEPPAPVAKPREPEVIDWTGKGDRGWVPNIRPGTQPDDETSTIVFDDEPGARSGRPVTKGAVKRHEVKDGESLFKIASKHYGTSAVWEKLAAYNTGRVGKDGAVRAGVTLMIPPRDVLDGKAILPSEQTGGTRPPAITPAPAPSSTKASAEKPDAAKDKPDPKYRTYVVKRGEDLSTIARQQLGSSRRVSDIIALNESIIRDENNVPAGLTLKIPSK